MVRMGAAVGGGQGGGEEEETRQAKEMAAARRRWEMLIREQKIKTLTPREAGYTFKLTDKVLLDVRPSNERQKAWVKGSTWIPVFDVDTSSDVNGLSKKAFSFVMGGWWSGSSTMSFNKNFVQQVQEKFSKDTDIILVCQKGLRSIAASEQLYNAGFENLFWVQGGLEAAEEELDGSATCTGCKGRMELSAALHGPIGWSNRASRCFIRRCTKYWPSASAIAVSLTDRFFRQRKMLWCSS
ncbi:hypothetical protein ACQ4PT_033039 [Festuca glaucescens]